MAIARCMLLSALLCSGAAQAASVTFSTTNSQLCIGAPGCGVASQTIGGEMTVAFLPVAMSTVAANPQSFASFGQLVVTCVGGGTGCGNQPLAGLSLYINFAQTQPTAGNGSLGGGVAVGELGGTASSATITWQGSTESVIGFIRYRVLGTSLALVPTSADSGRVSIQGEIADIGIFAGPAP